ncbi:MAG: 5'/3'-nucleotidase SurE [Candidatus Delongbacteria bacterium]|jgi:5'-nucleotidase|nr:5'/3'-nucleotidase SurE [Candidatus Delongbacteria bacterium]
MAKPFILISNDDGPDARGLHSLIKVAKEFGDIVVVVPEEGQSGKSHSITVKHPLRVREIPRSDDVIFYVVSGTPVDCLKIALDQLLDKKPDMVLSGIIHGSNSAISVMYSGTMGVVLEAGIHRIPAAGFSLLNHTYDADFTLSEDIIRMVVPKIMENSLPEMVVLNVNIPDINPEDFKGIEVCRQTFGVWQGEFEKRQDPSGNPYYWLTGYFENNEDGTPNTDEYVLKRNKVAIVPVKPDLTDFNSLQIMSEWSFND